MWDLLLGEFRHPPRVAKYLTWVELDAIIYGHARAKQQALIGSRLVATQIYNSLLMGERPKHLEPGQYLPLPLVDGPAKPTKQAGPPPEDFLARISARLGRPITIEA